MTYTDPGLPLVAVIGKTNVGKSTLVNRFVARRASIVSPAEGLTRDVLEREIDWRGRRFRVVDTGGLGPDKTGRGDDIAAAVSRRALAAASNADLVVFVIDAESGLTADDYELAEKLRRVTSPLILVANKVDDASGEASAADVWALGLGEPLYVSALHGRASGELLDRIVDLLPAMSRSTESPVEASISIVGRPNVGKSSLFNQLAGHERAVVHHTPGTTRDSIDTIVEVAGRRWCFVDTAGLRRRGKTKGTEVYSASRTTEAIARSDLAIIVLDASEGATAQDQRIAEMVAEAGVGAVIAANKWDLMSSGEEIVQLERSITDKLGFVAYAPLVRTSATTGRGTRLLHKEIASVLTERSIRIPTGRLNTVIQAAQQRTPPPRGTRGGRIVTNLRILYATQSAVSPPTFTVFASGYLPTEWVRFIERRLREEFGFKGNPLRIHVRQRSRRARGGARGG